MSFDAYKNWTRNRARSIVQPVGGDGIADLQIGLTTSGGHLLTSTDFML